MARNNNADRDHATADRRAAALRANLKRRKSQLRSLDKSDGDSASARHRKFVAARARSDDPPAGKTGDDESP